MHFGEEIKGGSTGEIGGEDVGGAWCVCGSEVVCERMERSEGVLVECGVLKCPVF